MSAFSVLSWVRIAAYSLLFLVRFSASRSLLTCSSRASRSTSRAVGFGLGLPDGGVGVGDVLLDSGDPALSSLERALFGFNLFADRA